MINGKMEKWKKMKTTVADGREIAGYGTYQSDIKAMDERGHDDTLTQVFHSVDIPEPFVVWGWPWIEAANPIIDWKAKQWLHAVDFESPNSFHDELEDSVAQMSQLWRLDADEPSNDDEGILPERYSTYKDVFSKQQAAILLTGFHQLHAIDLLDGTEPPFWRICPSPLRKPAWKSSRIS